MAKCPNCGRHLSITDWRPECPGCGVNLNYFNANENMLKEAEKAEKEHARFQPKIDRAKSAFFGSPFAIARIVLTFLPIGALFLPLCRLTGTEAVSVNAISVYNYISKADIGALLGKAASGDAFSVAFAALLLSVVLIPVSLLLIFMANGKHYRPRTIITYGLFFGFALVAFLEFSAFAKDPAAVSDYSSASVGAGGYVYLALTFLQLALNVFLAVKPIPVKYTQCFIGGLPSEEYFSLVEKGSSEEEIRRKMLVALTRLQLEAQEDEDQQEANV